MANALTDFTKKREFLVCMDSDGCVMNTVRIKHTTVMCPELIRVFALDEQADFITAAWDEINLHTITRGISRFESVRLVFDRLKNRGIEIPGSEDIAAWVDTATELSTASLQRELQKTGSLALRKLQEWNNACNRRIQALEPTFEPFPGVEESLRQLHAVADVAVVSAANESAIASEWKAMLWAMLRRPPPTVLLLCRSCRGVRPTAGAACRRRPCPSCCTAPSAPPIRPS